MSRSKLASQLKYRIPLIKLCLVHEGNASAPYAIRSADDAAQFLEPLRYAAEEHFVSLHLNARNEIIGLHEVSHGTLSSSLVHPREVFKAALLANSHAIIVCHNHPSGSSIYPSCEDIAATRQLLQAADIVGVLLIDHVIVGPGQPCYSMRLHHSELWPGPVE